MDFTLATLVNNKRHKLIHAHFKGTLFSLFCYSSRSSCSCVCVLAIAEKVDYIQRTTDGVRRSFQHQLCWVISVTDACVFPPQHRISLSFFLCVLYVLSCLYGQFAICRLDLTLKRRIYGRTRSTEEEEKF